MNINSTKLTQQTNGGKTPEKLSPQAEAAMQKANEVAKEFETMFVDLMLKSMRSTAMPEDASNAHSMFQGMLDSEYSKNMTEANDFGVRGLIMDWMKQNDPALNKSDVQKGLGASTINPKNAKTDQWEYKNALRAYENQKNEIPPALK